MEEEKKREEERKLREQELLLLQEKAPDADKKLESPIETEAPKVEEPKQEQPPNVTTDTTGIDTIEKNYLT